MYPQSVPLKAGLEWVETAKPPQNKGVNQDAQSFTYSFANECVLFSDTIEIIQVSSEKIWLRVM